MKKMRIMLIVVVDVDIYIISFFTLLQYFIFLMLKLFETSGLKLIKSRIRVI